MAERRITIAIGARTEDAQRGLSALQSGLQKFADAVRTGFGVDVVARFNNALQRGVNLLQDAVQRGLNFNSLLEDSRVGIAASLKQFLPEQFSSFTEAMTAAGDALEALKEKAVESPATLGELVQAFQSISGAALSAGMSVQQTVDLTVLMSQALAGMGIRSEQIIQESRALLTGNINQDAAAAKMLGITAEQIRLAREEGRLYEFLTQRMSAYGESGKVAAGNFTTLRSALTDLFDTISGEVTKPMFEQLKREMEALRDVITDSAFVEGLRGTGVALAELVKLLGNLSRFGAENSDVIGPTFVAMSSAILGVGKAVELLKKALGGVSMYQLFSALWDVVEEGWIRLMAILTAAWIKTRLLMQEMLLEAVGMFNKVPFAPEIDTTKLRAGIEETRAALDRLQKKRDELLDPNADTSGDAMPLPEGRPKKSGKGRVKEAVENEDTVKARETLLQQINDAYGKASLSRLAIAEAEYKYNLLRVQQEVKDAESAEIAKLQLKATYEKQKAEIEKDIREKALSADRDFLAKLTQARELVESDYQSKLQETSNLFEAGSIRKIEAIRRNNQAIEEYRDKLIELLQILMLMSDANPQMPGLAEEIARIEQAILQLKGAFQDESFIGTLRQNLRALADEWSAIGRNMANVMTQGVGRAVDGVSDSIMGMIDGTKTWGQAFANVARAIIADLIRVVVQWVAQMTIVRALRRIMDTEQVASAAQRTAAEAPAAVATSISSYGAAAAIGVAALLAGLAVGIAAFADGGLVRGRGGPRSDSNLVAVSAGEYIVNAAAVGEYGLGFLEAINSRSLDATSGLPTASVNGGNVTVSPAPLNLAILNNKEQLREFMRSNEGRKMIVEATREQALELGLES